MKVLKNNYENNQSKKENIEPYPRFHVCQSCYSELEYDESDLRIGALGLTFLDCPLCEYENIIEDNENTIELTKDNIEFPIHFFHTSKETGAVDVCTNEYIKESINKAIKYFRINKDEIVWISETGNTFITVFRFDGDENYYIVVTNDYYSTYIPFEEEDYKVVY